MTSNDSKAVHFAPLIKNPVPDQLELQRRTYKCESSQRNALLSSYKQKLLVDDDSRNVYIDCGHLTSTSPLHNVIDRSLSPVVAANAHLKPSLKKRINSSSEEPIRKTSKLRRGWESSSASGSKSTSSPELPPTPPSPLCTKSPFKRNQLFRQSASVGFNSNLLNYSSNYQSVFDLTAEGDTTNNNPLLSTHPVTFDFNSVSKKENKVGESFVSSSSGKSAATTLSGQHLVTTPATATCGRRLSTSRLSPAPLTPSVNNPSNTSLVTQQGSPPSSPRKRHSLVDILISPAKKKFHFSFARSPFCKLRKSNSTNVYVTQSSGFSLPSTPLSSQSPKGRHPLKFPKETKFIFSTFLDPEPETFVLKMKLKEKIKIKPRSQSTSSRGTKRSTEEFSDVHFGGRGSKAREIDHEDDGGFSQYQQLQQSFFNSRKHQDSPDSGAMSPNAGPEGGVGADGVPVTTITRRVKSVVDKPGSSSKGGRDHSNCLKCNRAQPDSFQTIAIPHPHDHSHDHPHKRAPSEDWGLNGEPPRSSLKDGRHRFASESNLLGPMRPVPLGYSPSVQNVFSPSTPGAFLPYGGSTNGPAGGLGGKSPGHGNNHGGNGTGASPGFGLGGAGTLPVGGMNSLMRPVGNNCYVQCGTEVKKVNLPTGDEHGDRSDGVAGGGPSLSSMRELHGLVAAAFPIAVTEDDFLQKKKIVYIKDEASGIYYELEDIEDVKPRCFLSIRDYNAPNLPIYDRADANAGGARGLSRSTAESSTTPFATSPGTGGAGGRLNSRPPLKLSVFQPVAQSPRTGISKNQALPYPVSGSQPVGLDQIDRSASFSQGKVSEPLNRNAGGGTNPGVQTLGRNFSWTDNLKANANTQHSIGRPSGFDDRKGGNNDIGDFVDDAVIAADKSDLLMTKGANLTNEDGFSSQESDALQMTSSTSYNRRYGGANDKENMSPHNKGLSTSNSRNLESSESTNVTTRELIDKSSTIIIRDGSANANNGDANNKLDHIELQLGDLTHLVNTLIMRQHDKDSAMRSSSERLLFENGSAAKKEGKEGEESKKQASELATLEQLQRLFQQQLAQVNSQKTSNVNLMHHHQFISSVKEDSPIAFDQLCAVREKVRHLRLELNQLKRAHANHVTNGQLMIREASQRITSAIDAFAQHSKKEEDARSKRTSALAQAWALHLATLDKLESEICEMELMVEKIKSDADHYNKHGNIAGQFGQDGGADFKAIWDRRIEQLTQSVQDTGLLISKVKVDLLEFESQLAELVRLGGAVGDSQRKLMKDGPERLTGFIERIRTLSHHLAALKEIEFNAREIDLSLNRPQSTPPELPTDRNLLSPADKSVFEDSFGQKSSRVFSSHSQGKSPARSPNYDPAFITSYTTKSRSYATLNEDDRAKTAASSALNCYTGNGQMKDGYSYHELITDLDTASSAPSPPVNLSGSASLLTQQQTVVKKRSANQVKKKRSDGSASRERSDSSASILDTAYVTDKDDLEVIRNKTNMSSMSSSSSKNVTRTSRVSTSRHRSTNREVLIDDYYSTVEQLQRSNRDLSAKSKDQRCRTDLLVTQSAEAAATSQPVSKTPSVRSLSPASTAGGGNKQVTTYTYYTITKDGQKKTVYGGKQQKVVPTESET